MKTNKKTTVGPLMTLTSGAILIVLFLLLPATAQAQWTTADASGNINNTNTNNVGVGTTTPNYKVDVTTSADKSQFRFGLGAGDSGGFLYSNGASHATLAGGASVNGGWFARSLSASIIEANLGQITFYANSGLSTGSAFTPTARMRITSGGNVGIGTNSPAYKLHLVSGTDTATSLLSLDTGVHGGTLMTVGGTTNNESYYDMSVYYGGSYISRFGVTNLGRMYLNPNGGSVGIGTSNPAYPLDVRGPGTWVATFTRTDNSNGGILVDSPAGYNPNVAFATGGLVKWYMNSNAIDADKMQFWESSGTQVRFTLTQAGSLGLGTVSPAYKLDVQGGQINSSGGLCIAGDCKTAWSQVGGTSQWTGSTALNFSGNVGVGMTTAPSRRLEVLGGNVFHQWSTTGGSEYGFYTSINNNHLSSNLYFDGAWKMIAAGKGAFVSSAPLGGLALAVYGDNTSRAANAVASPTHLMSVTLGGNMGVGTSSPVFDANVSKYLTLDGGSGSIGSIGAAGGTSSNGTSVGQVAFVNSNLGTTEKRVSTIVGGTDTATNSGFLSFYTASGGVFTTPQMRILANGNVGIATSTPTEKLEVTGNVKVSGTVEGGNIKAKYQDVAEWVESSQELAGGTVVVLDSDKSNHVIASTQAYDGHVAGVISLQPGISLGEQSEGRVLVATTGRVKVKVDATNGPIKIGDLLVTSDKEGVAMKSVPVEIGGVRIHRPGTLIGKALEPLASGTGEILVLLSLQ